MSETLKKVLVTGANGFVASHTVHQLLQKGYFVRGTVRSSAKAEQLKAKFPEHKNNLELIVKDDITKASSYDGLLQEIEGIFHIASPVGLHAETNNKVAFIDPAVNNTLAIMEAASQVPSIKKIVITSSFAAVRDPTKPSDYVFSEKDWNPITMEEAMAGSGLEGYRASKKFAEKAVWDFVEQRKPTFDVVTIQPPFIFGPNTFQTIEKLSDLNASSKLFYDVVLDNKPLDTFSDLYVDVRDCARGHILAYEKPITHQRYLVCAGNYHFQQLADLVHKEFPQITTAQVGNPGITPPVKFRATNEKSVRELGMTYISRDDTFRDSVRELLDLQAKGKLQ